MDEIGAELADQGRVVRLTTTGRASGRPRIAHLGFVAEPDGSLLVAAGDPGADWAANLDADPRAVVSLRDTARPVIAERLDGPAAAAVVTAQIIKYGTPAERLGRGPAYRLRPDGGGR